MGLTRSDPLRQAPRADPFAATFSLARVALSVLDARTFDSQTFRAFQPEAGLAFHHINSMLLRNQSSATLCVRYYREE